MTQQTRRLEVEAVFRIVPRLQKPVLADCLAKLTALLAALLFSTFLAIGMRLNKTPETWSSNTIFHFLISFFLCNPPFLLSKRTVCITAPAIPHASTLLPWQFSCKLSACNSVQANVLYRENILYRAVVIYQ